MIALTAFSIWDLVSSIAFLISLSTSEAVSAIAWPNSFALSAKPVANCSAPWLNSLPSASKLLCNWSEISLARLSISRPISTSPLPNSLKVTSPIHEFNEDALNASETKVAEATPAAPPAIPPTTKFPPVATVTAAPEKPPTARPIALDKRALR